MRGPDFLWRNSYTAENIPESHIEDALSLIGAKAKRRVSEATIEAIKRARNAKPGKAA